jgi:hypothetical protein
MADWTPVEKTATGADGAKMAFTGGKWVPAEKTATGDGGKKMAILRGEVQAPAANEPQQQPAGEQQPQEPAGGSAAPHTAKQAAANIATQTTVGGAVSAMAPELIMYGAAPAAAAVTGFFGTPATGALVGEAVYTFGAGLRASRLAMAAAGAASSAIGAAAGEVTRKAGGSELAVTGTEIGVGALTPTGIVGTFVPKGAKAAWSVVQNLAEGKAAGANRAEVAGRDLIRGVFGKDMPEHDMHAILKKGVEADAQAAEQAANSIMAKAYGDAAKVRVQAGQVQKPSYTAPTEAEEIVKRAQEQVAQVRKDAAARAQKINAMTQNRMAATERIGKQAEHELNLTVGKPQELSDVGEQLTQKISTRKQETDAIRKQTDEKLRGARDAEVQAKEQSGQFIDELPEYKALRAEIAAKIQKTPAGRAASTITTDAGKEVGLTRVKESGVESAYEKIWDAISAKKVLVGQTPEGAPQYEIFKTTHEALDHVRRKLGDAAYGKEAEGYGALGQDLAKKMYERISKVQEAYAPNTQRALQANYTQQLEHAEKFKTQMGRMALNEDKSAAGMPKAFFKDRDGVRDLRELTGDPQLVDVMAQSYVSRTLAGRSSKQVQEWAKAPGQTDWMREVPGLRQRVDDYAAKLAKIEAKEGASAGRVAKLQKEKEAIRTGTLPATEKMLTQAQGEAAKVTKAAEGKHAQELAKAETQQQRLNAAAAKQEAQQKQKILGQGYKDAEALKEKTMAQAKAIVSEKMDAGKLYSMLTTGDAANLGKAFAYVAGAPGGKRAIEGTVRKAVANVSPNKLEQVWDGRLKVALQEGKVLPPATIAKMDADIKAAYKKMAPEAAKTFTQRLVHRMMATTAGSLPGKGAAMLVGGEAED